ncbi:ankyrin repeat domain-containing protein, partial [Caulobacter sp. 17J65-9]|uniref:ankyrin repeat domain-containing protein n=1 Tax=Caulobacter sp. 17J65-9 TaxID=2709382 RepID=UPI0013CAB13A
MAWRERMAVLLAGVALVWAPPAVGQAAGSASGKSALPVCQPDDAYCLGLRAKTERLNRRDPAAEAAAAAARGDFRLGAYQSIGPMPMGWETPGVACSAWTRELISKWHVTQDVVRVGDHEHSVAAIAFLAAYNRAVVAQPGFPYTDVCAPKSAKPAARYTGPVRDAGQAARSGDPAAVAALPAGVDVNAVDPLGKRPLEWAAARGDEPMMLALLARGADPNLREWFNPAPLALALKQDRFDLARAMIAHGAEMRGDPGLCDFPAKPGQPPCSWIGVLVEKRRWDLLDDAVRILDASAPANTVDIRAEATPTFFAAVAANDAEAFAHLLPHVGRSGGEMSTLDRLYGLGRRDLVRAYVASRGARAARSEAEARLWRAAAEAGQDDALAFMHDFGAELNLLPKARLDACEAKARAGSVEGLLACVREAGEREQRLNTALAAGDVATARGLLVEAADLRERNKPALLYALAATGSLPLVEIYLAVEPRPVPFVPGAPAQAAYAGPYREAAQAALAKTARPRATYALGPAARRGDAAMVRRLAEA